MTYMEVWNRVLYLTQHEPESAELPGLLQQLDQLDATEKGVLGISLPGNGQRRPA